VIRQSSANAALDMSDPVIRIIEGTETSVRIDGLLHTAAAFTEFTENGNTDSTSAVAIVIRIFILSVFSSVRLVPQSRFRVLLG
jgi:hypothetical protein